MPLRLQLVVTEQWVSKLTPVGAARQRGGARRTAPCDARPRLLALAASLMVPGLAVAQAIDFAPPVDNTNAHAVANLERGDSLDFFVADKYTVDQNLFRLPASPSYLTTYVGPNASREDHINIVSAGADAQKTWNRQLLLLNIQVDHNHYARNSDFDAITGNGAFLWDWQAGSYWSGEAGATYNRFIPNFQNTLYYAHDTISSLESFGKATFQGGPHWSFSGGVSDTDTSHSSSALRPDDFRSKSESLGVHYFTLAEGSIGWDYIHSEGSFASDGVFNSVSYSRDFRNNSARFTAKYALSGSTVLNASAGYLDHKNPGSGIGAFSGDVWRVSLAWSVLAKVQMVFSGWRDLYAYLDAQSAFFVSKGFGVAPTWTPRDKITLTLLATRETHDFLGAGDGAPNVIQQFDARRDKLTLEQLSVLYTPRKALSLKLSVQHQQRNSNIQRFVYNDNLLAADLTFTF